MSEPTNEDRANRIDKMIEYYATQCKGDAYADENDFRDILTDMMHYCRGNCIGFYSELDGATGNFEAEKEEAGDTKPLYPSEIKSMELMITTIQMQIAKEV